MQVVPLGHDWQLTQRAPTPNSNLSTHCLLSLHSSQWIVEGTPHTGRPLSVIRQMPLGRSGHAVPGDAVFSHDASSIVQPWARLGSCVHLLRRLLHRPEQHCDDWRQRSPGGRQAAAAPGARPMSQNPEANAAIAAQHCPPAAACGDGLCQRIEAHWVHSETSSSSHVGGGGGRLLSSKSPTSAVMRLARRIATVRPTVNAAEL
jgi:hypothetical protein